MLGRVRHRLALLNSTVAFALAVLLTISWHEFGHAAAALGLGLTPTVYPFAVDTGTKSSGQEIVTALAGPLLSLLTGMLLLVIHRTTRPPAFWGLTVLWLGLLGVQEFAGYLITGLFFTAGDIGQALTLSRSPVWVGVLLFVAGWVVTYANGRYATGELVRLTDADAPLAPQLRDLGLFAWLLGASLALVLSAASLDFGPLGVGIGLFEALGTLTIGLFLLFVRLFMRRLPAQRRAPAWGIPVAGVLALAAVAVARQLLLARGATL